MPNCEKCGKPLRAIGTARKNGKNHPDWDSRNLHKKCWKEEETLKKNMSYINFHINNLIIYNKDDK